jgi:hypothetical protein
MLVNLQFSASQHGTLGMWLCNEVEKAQDIMVGPPFA